MTLPEPPFLLLMSVRISRLNKSSQKDPSGLNLNSASGLAAVCECGRRGALPAACRSELLDSDNEPRKFKDGRIFSEASKSKAE